MKIHKGKRPAPDRIFLYGVEGVGKSSFAASAPNPIFIAAEDGVRHLDVASFDGIETYGDVADAIAYLESGEHDFRTVVIDTADWVEPMLWAHLCAQRGWKDIEAPGFGKGYTAANDVWRSLVASLDLLRVSRAMQVVLVAHSSVKSFKNPTGDDFDRYEPKLQKGAAALLKEWADAVLFASFEEWTTKENPKAKAKGASSGARIIHTERTAAWDAKNRYGLPPTLALSWEEYASTRDDGEEGRRKALLAEAQGLYGMVPEETAAKARDFIEGLTSASEIALAVNTLRQRAAESQEVA